MLNVFRRDRDAIRHFWGSELLYAATDPGQDPRHSDTIDPLWNLFEFTPEGARHRLVPAAELLMTADGQRRPRALLGARLIPAFLR